MRKSQIRVNTLHIYTYNIHITLLSEDEHLKMRKANKRTKIIVKIEIKAEGKIKK